MGDKGRGLVAVALLGAVVLMVIGYRAAELTPVYFPLEGVGHLTVLLMLVAVFMMGAGSAKGVVASKLRHPMLTGAVIWAVAHLLVNGDQASVLLFGSMALWALLEMQLISRAEGAWVRPEAGPVAKDVRVAVISVVIFAVIAGDPHLAGPQSVPGNLPMKLYRFLTADDTSAFCHKVTAALNKGWELHGTPPMPSTKPMG